MRYVKMALACGLLGIALVPSLAQMSTAPTEQDVQKIQLQHVVIATEVCRSEADAVVGTIEASAREKHGVAFYTLFGAKGARILVTKETFADYYVLKCFPKKVLEDPVLSGAPDISAEVPDT